MNVITIPKETLHLKSKLRLLPRALPAPYRSQRVQLLPLNPLSNSSLTYPARIVSLSQGLDSPYMSCLVVGYLQSLLLFSPLSLSSCSATYTGGGSIDLWRRYASDKFSDMGLDPGAGSDKVQLLCVWFDFDFERLNLEVV